MLSQHKTHVGVVLILALSTVNAMFMQEAGEPAPGGFMRYLLPSLMMQGTSGTTGEVGYYNPTAEIQNKLFNYIFFRRMFMGGEEAGTATNMLPMMMLLGQSQSSPTGSSV